jgi:hypothetical protein
MLKIHVCYYITIISTLIFLSLSSMIIHDHHASQLCLFNYSNKDHEMIYYSHSQSLLFYDDFDCHIYVFFMKRLICLKHVKKNTFKEIVFLLWKKEYDHSKMT